MICILLATGIHSRTRQQQQQQQQQQHSPGSVGMTNNFMKLELIQYSCSNDDQSTCLQLA